jgi:TfoX/Sxy family transcriptional regulator of competence genes
MASDPKLVARLERLLVGRHSVSARVMFGGVCFVLNGNVCVGVYKDQLILRVGEERASAMLSRAHVRPMDITGKPMKGWLMVAPAGVRDKRQLARYVDAALAFVTELPAKDSVLAVRSH